RTYCVSLHAALPIYGQSLVRHGVVLQCRATLTRSGWGCNGVGSLRSQAEAAAAAEAEGGVRQASGKGVLRAGLDAHLFPLRKSADRKSTRLNSSDVK